ncbi:methyltransferase [Neoasaia chiangmaiensis NBRC 101099]|uniref:class I SAM-dependent methyltransferase n=1 Tax=Neoasaia chiangmaiensis TaxID=320497 RepID=UPI001196986D|nr:class I SAM-dependent methyltransferase [Neoasaia chiangmaiensis]GBR35574.1 methyltransferase [Neoasaia chiangmaiensis NBRC 101099]GEN16398.1 demethylmenaquinone methyltransferase [Neoasaia chiangmaiensis]
MPDDPNPPHPILSAYYRSESDRVTFVRSLFDGTARYYDRINAIFSLGTGRWYRRHMLGVAGLKAGHKLIDVATGTGLVAREAERITGKGNVIGLDMSPGMLAECRRRSSIDVIQADAQRLPVANASMDMLSMGYALRHVHDLGATFGAFLNVLKPGGNLIILEIGRARSRRVQAALRVYLGRVVPFLSGVTASAESRTLMTYYWDTIEECVAPESILAALQQAGFSNVRKQTHFGVFHAYLASRPINATALNHHHVDA